MSCGTRTQDFRPGDPDGASFLRSSLGDQLPTTGVLRTAGTALLRVLLVMRTAQWPVTAPLFGSQPRLPVLRLLWLGTPLPNFPVRAPAADAFTRGTAPLLHCWELHTHGYRTCHDRGPARRPLITAGHPVRPPVPSPSCNNPGFETPPPHRPANCNYLYCGYCLPAVRLCQALLSFSATEETIATPLPNVYSGQCRFSCARQRGNRLRRVTQVGRRAVAPGCQPLLGADAAGGEERACVIG